MARDASSTKTSRQSAADQPSAKPLRELLTSVNATSEAAQKFWIVLLTLAIYLLITISGITHLDLLLDTPANLPLISIKVPLVGFFVAAPALLVAVHFSLLLQHELLFYKISELQVAINKATGKARIESLAIWSELHWYFFAQAFSGAHLRLPIWIALQGLIVTSLLLFPAMLLFYFQIAFLPYHAVEVTWWHRGCLTFDVVLLLFFANSFWRANRNVGRKLLPSPFTNGPIRGPIRRALFRAAVRPGSLVLLRSMASARRVGILRLFLFAICVFSIGVATVPDEALDRIGRRIWPVRVPLYEPSGNLLSRYRQRIVFYPTALIFERYRDASSAIA